MDPDKRRELEQRRRDLRATRIRCAHGVVESDPDKDRACGGQFLKCRCCGLLHCVDGGHKYLCRLCEAIPTNDGGLHLHRHIPSSIQRRGDEEVTLCGHSFDWGTWYGAVPGAEPCGVCEAVDKALS